MSGIHGIINGIINVIDERHRPMALAVEWQHPMVLYMVLYHGIMALCMAV